MVKIKYDSSEVDRSKSAVEPPNPGIYKMIIREVKHYPAKDGKDPYLEFVVRMDQDDSNGKGKGYGFWDRVTLNKASAWKLDQYLMSALGIDTTKKAKGDFDPAQFVNKEIRGQVKSEYYEEQYKPKLGTVYSPQNVDDDDDEDFDEDEVDEIEEDVEDEVEDEELEEDDEEEFEDEDEEEAPHFLDGLTRDALKAVIKAENLQIKVLKSMTDDDLRRAIKDVLPEPDEEEDEEEDDETAAPDYESWSREAVVAELKKRGLAVTGNVAAKIARLRANDDDPFEEG